MKMRRFNSMPMLLLCCMAWFYNQTAFGQSWPPVLPACERADCGENPFCHFDFNEFEIFWGTVNSEAFFLQMGIPYCGPPPPSNPLKNTPDILYFFNNESDRFLQMQYYPSIPNDPFPPTPSEKEFIYIPIKQGLAPHCFLSVMRITG